MGLLLALGVLVLFGAVAALATAHSSAAPLAW